MEHAAMVIHTLAGACLGLEAFHNLPALVWMVATLAAAVR